MLAVLALATLLAILTLAACLPFWPAGCRAAGPAAGLLLAVLLLPAGKLFDLAAQALDLSQLLVPLILSGALLRSVGQRLLGLANAVAHAIHGAIHRRQPSRLVHLIAAPFADILGRILQAALHVILLDLADTVPETRRGVGLGGAQVARRTLDILLQLLQVFQVLTQIGRQLLGLLPVEAVAALGITRVGLLQAIL